MYAHRSGFRPGEEQVSTHARRRYRLRQHPSLWLICYHQADARDHRPVYTVKFSDETRQMLSQRAQLQRNKSQLVRKAFMLHDTQNFPTVSLPSAPGGQAPYPQQPMGYPGNIMAQMSQNQFNPYVQQQRQQQAMAAQAGFGPSPSKRPRHGSMTHAPVSTTAIPGPLQLQERVHNQEALEESESTGADYMDILTPRDIALERYVKHHEWLEEILSSPFDTHRIVPPELGLGRKGELESLTMDFFDAPTIDRDERDPDSLKTGNTLPDPEDIDWEIAESNRPVVEEIPIKRVGKLEGSKAVDFNKRATDRVAEINAEMKTLRKQHAKRMAKLSRGLAYKEAEQKVRLATLELINGDAEETAPKQEKQIEDLSKNLELKEGRDIKPVAIVECTEKGGQEEIQQKPTEELQDFDMTDTFDLDGAQLETPSEPASQQEPAMDQPTAPNTTLPTSDLQATSQPSSALGGEVQATQQQPETRDIAAEDYVMVDKEDGSAPQDIVPPQTTGSTDSAALAHDGQDISGEILPDFEGGQEEIFEPNDFGDEGIDFGDMDTVGDELSGYAQEIANMGAGESNDLGLNSPPTESPLPGTGAPPDPSDPSSP